MSRPAYGRPDGDAELAELVEILNRTYLRTREEGEQWLKRTPAEDLRVIRRSGRVAGSLLLLPWAQWFGGSSIPMTGVAAVGVDPEVRSSGMASSMMRSALEEMHQAGVPLSALFPATQPVYRRAGYELSGTWSRFKLPVHSVDLRDRTLDIKRVDASAAKTIKALYDRRSRSASGHLDRPPKMWERLVSPERDEIHLYVASGSGGPEGYVAFTQRRDKEWRYDLVLQDFVALTAAAARRLWTFFADHRSFSRDVLWVGHVADPVLLMLREQQWEVTRMWTWMTRIVDVKSALEARGYPRGLEAELHLQVADDVLPWNDGRFVLEVSGGHGAVRKGGRGKLSVDVRGLASMYTGFLTGAETVAAGYASGSEAELSKASAVFAGPPPWLPDFF